MWTKQQLWQTLLLIAGIALVLFSAAAVFKFGFATFAVSVPIAVVGFVIYKMFMGTLNISREQAAQASRHVEELSHYISEQERITKILQKSEKQFRNSFEYAAIGMALVSPLCELLRVNRSLAKILGCKMEDLLDTSLLSLVVPDDLDPVKVNLARLLDGVVQSSYSETRVFRKDREIRWLMWSASLVREASNEPSHYILQFEDITDRKKAENRLLHNAMYDALTDLPNRFLFLDRLQVAFNRALRQANNQITVLHIDFDRFKLVNDRFGQRVGDKMLVEAANRLRKSTRASNTVARLGADEFAVLIEEGSFEQALAIVEHIRLELSRPFDIDGELIYLTVSIGVAVASQSYESPEFLLRDADTALNNAKRLGRDRYEIFAEEMHIDSIQFLQMETDLRHALERNEFKMYYQPIVELESGNLAGFESLIRWEHPDRGLVSPAEFIPIAEDTGLIIPIGEWILRESCRQLREWQKLSDRSADLWVSVNVSSKQFVKFDLVTLVADTLEETGLSPRCLKLEITESTMVENIDYVATLMEQLKLTGVKLSIDDFGTGFSSLSILHRFPLDILKIDRSFVAQIKDAEVSVEVVKTIVARAQ